MNTEGCCDNAANGLLYEPFAVRTKDVRSRRPTFARRCLDGAGWLIPSALLVFMPKCPACFAAYIAIGTGLGLSITTATNLRLVLIILCIGSLLFLAARHIRRLIVRLPADI